MDGSSAAVEEFFGEASTVEHGEFNEEVDDELGNAISQSSPVFSCQNNGALPLAGFFCAIAVFSCWFFTLSMLSLAREIWR